MKKTDSMKVKSDVRAGYRPVHGLVYPDSLGRWMKGWYDMDSRDRLDNALGGATPPPPPPM
ncbi:MAG: hypothetical protein WCI88_09470 [Chloroflexota bacterium]|jgi:hypothetical protein